MYGNFAPGQEDDHLFSKIDIRDALAKQSFVVEQEISGLNEDYILSVAEDDLVNSIYEKFEAVTPVLGQPQLEEKQSKLDVSQDPLRLIHNRNKRFLIDVQELTVCIPFTGDAILFDVCPTTFSLSPPTGRVTGNEIQFSFKAERIDPEKVKQEIEQRISNINSTLNSLRMSTNDFNGQLKEKIRNLYITRKTAILDRKGMAASIGYPLKKRQESLIYETPLVRKALPQKKSSVSKVQFRPEPEVAVSEYEHILEILCRVGRMMEYSPHMFLNLGEEDIRTHFLFQLNGHYEGGVTGETFNGDGKTDILVRAEGGGNVFVGECKFWRGPKQFTETIDQLLGYVTWRDSKTAILVFCKNKDGAAVQNQLAPLVRQHPNYKRESNVKDEMGERFVMKNKYDDDKEFLMTVLFFCVPCEQTSDSPGIARDRLD